MYPNGKVWRCKYCGETFKTKKEVQKHVTKCRRTADINGHLWDVHKGVWRTKIGEVEVCVDKEEIWLTHDESWVSPSFTLEEWDDIVETVKEVRKAITYPRGLLVMPDSHPEEAQRVVDKIKKRLEDNEMDECSHCKWCECLSPENHWNECTNVLREDIYDGYEGPCPLFEKRE